MQNLSVNVNGLIVVNIYFIFSRKAEKILNFVKMYGARCDLIPFLLFPLPPGYDVYLVSKPCLFPVDRQEKCTCTTAKD